MCSAMTDHLIRKRDYGTDNATFYWTDYDNTYMGSTYKSTGNHGSAGVYGIGTEQNRDVYYYKVISNHSATYNGGSYSYSNLTVFDP